MSKFTSEITPNSSSTGSYFWPIVIWAGKVVGFVIVGLIHYHQDKLLYIPNPSKAPEENPPSFTSPAATTTTTTTLITTLDIRDRENLNC